MDLIDFVGLAGTVLILLAYAGVQFKRLDPHRFAALALNFFGAALVLVSLRYHFNLAAALLEGVWALIALAGLLRLAFAHGRRGD